MAPITLGPWNFVHDVGSSGHLGLIIAPGEETNGKILLISFLASIK